ncbi:hypothetical protein BDV12DRAFT_179279 [Aspergillus spectabilis]
MDHLCLQPSLVLLLHLSASEKCAFNVLSRHPPVWCHVRQIPECLLNILMKNLYPPPKTDSRRQLPTPNTLAINYLEPRRLANAELWCGLCAQIWANLDLKFCLATMIVRSAMTPDGQSLIRGIRCIFSVQPSRTLEHYYMDTVPIVTPHGF